MTANTFFVISLYQFMVTWISTHFTLDLEKAVWKWPGRKLGFLGNLGYLGFFLSDFSASDFSKFYLFSPSFGINENLYPWPVHRLDYTQIRKLGSSKSRHFKTSDLSNSRGGTSTSFVRGCVPQDRKIDPSTD